MTYEREVWPKGMKVEAMSETPKSVTDGMVTYPVYLGVGNARQLADSYLAKYADVRTLCNVIRDIFALTQDERIKDLCREAVLMGKRLDDEIRRAGKPDYDKGMWAKEHRC
jgi:hypothetical protein